MRFGNQSTGRRSMLPWLLMLLIISAVWLINCNDHRFTPLADIEVYPDVIDYEVQRTSQLTEEILITNKGVSAKLEIYEINLEDSSGGVLTEEYEPVTDQTQLMQNLVPKRLSDGSAIAYLTAPMGLISDVSCEDDSYCHCTPDTESGETCTYALGDSTVNKERMGEGFVCAQHPLNPNAGKVCLAYFKYFNNAGNTFTDEAGEAHVNVARQATWGGESKTACTDSTACTRLGPDFVCKASGVCGTDIQFGFSMEYGLERMVAVNSELVDTDKAAVWKSIDGREICLVDEQGNTTSDSAFYGLNRCDQMALKRYVSAIDDGDDRVGYRLVPKRQANYRVMVSAVEGEIGQAKYVTFCDNGEAVGVNDIMLDDPLAGQDCLNSDNEVKSDLLSISPENVKLDQLPVRILYDPMSDYDSAAVLSGKIFTMRIFNSARVGNSYERTVSLTLPENRGGPPIPIIEIPADQQDPEPLDVIHLDGRNSESPFGDERKPFQYYWEWAPGGKPAYAQDAVLIESTGDFDNPRSIMGKWTAEGYPKIFFPIAGEYKIRLRVKDAAGVESGPNDDCPTCPEYDEITIKVKPSQKLHVELIWDRGDQVDLDLFLVRYRADGTFAVPAPFQDRIQPPQVTMYACEDDSDCYDGAFTCNTGTGYCQNSCQSDADCKAVSGGWYCNEFNECAIHADGVIECESDADCNGGSCNPSKVRAEYKMICTSHNSDSVNDTCFFLNGQPRWGEYDNVSLGCVSDTDCNSAGDETFACGTNDFCDFTCNNSAECLGKSPQYLCGEGGACVGNNQDDDPTLDIDDVDGWGPENISLKEPVTGTYRVVARLYADPYTVVNNTSPNGPVKAFVQIYLNGELALSKGIGHELYSPSTYWKVADIEWDSTLGEGGDGEVLPICAGWTLTKCGNTADCEDWYGDDYSCGQRQWGKFCSTCNGLGAPDECNPTIACSSDADCVNEISSKICSEIKADYCKCEGSNEYGSFEADPYANPFITSVGGQFDPNDDLSSRSIWCDAPEQKYNDTDACSSLY